MDIISNLSIGFGVAFTPINLLYAFVGCFLGTVIGVLPGIGPVATIAMLLPATYALPPVSALIMLAGIYYGAQPSGVLAGFCYAIKLPGLMAVAGAVLFVAAQRRWKPVLIVAAGAALMMAPWTLRALVLTGNPVAPLMNSVFPNPYFHIATERELAASLRSLGDVRPAQVPWELAFGDRLTGTFGPLLLARRSPN